LGIGRDKIIILVFFSSQEHRKRDKKDNKGGERATPEGQRNDRIPKEDCYSFLDKETRKVGKGGPGKAVKSVKKTARLLTRKKGGEKVNERNRNENGQTRRAEWWANGFKWGDKTRENFPRKNNHPGKEQDGKKKMGTTRSIREAQNNKNSIKIGETRLGQDGPPKKTRS